MTSTVALPFLKCLFFEEYFKFFILRLSFIEVSSFLYFEFLKLIFPFHVYANPVLADLVGITQSNISIPLFTAPNISEGVPTPIKYLGLFLGIIDTMLSRTSNICF